MAEGEGENERKGETKVKGKTKATTKEDGGSGRRGTGGKCEGRNAKQSRVGKGTGVEGGGD